jgi:hypothetical protein
MERDLNISRSWSDCHHYKCAHSAGVTEREGSVLPTWLTIAARRVNTFSARLTKERSDRQVFHSRRQTSVPSAEMTARESSDNPASRHSSTGVAKCVAMCGRVVSTPVKRRNRTTFAESLARPMETHSARWFGFWMDRQRYRRRQAYFRPTDTLALDAALVELIDRIVNVRFADVAGADTPFAGQPLYRIFEPKRSGSTFMRPERDFDFLE